MPQISIIKKSDIQKARRFDAEFFKPEYLEIEKKISSIDNKKLKYLCKFRNNKRVPIEKSLRKEGNYPYYGAQGITGYIDEYIFDGNYLLVAEDGENLRSRNQDIACSVFGKFWVNNHAHILEFSDKKLQNIVEIFLNLSPLRVVTGVAQPKLSKENLENIKIPILPQSFQLQIEKIVKSAYEKQTKSKQLYKEAEEALLKELDLLNYKPEHILNFETTKKEIDEAKRFDAEYFQPKYGKIIKKIENYKNGWDYVKNIVNWKKGVEVGSEAYRQDGMSFGRVADCSINGVADTGKKISKELYKELKNDYQPKQDDILFTKDGTIGLSYVVKEEFDLILSGAFLRLSLKDKYQTFEKECLSLIFNSIISKMQVEKLSGGAIIAHLKPSDFEKFKIPLINPKIQKQIAKKIQESHKLRKESKKLLEEAKRKVEEEIEKEAEE